eukprot:COSAG04_NODE_1491_length_6548_cov_2.928539_5_plen_97_part_00
MNIGRGSGSGSGSGSRSGSGCCGSRCGSGSGQRGTQGHRGAMEAQGHDAIHEREGIVHPDFKDAYALMNAEVHELVKSVHVRRPPRCPLTAATRCP